MGIRDRTGELAVPFAHAAQDKVSSMNHDPYYHEFPYSSNTIMVLVFSELESFVRKILQREENKGVELAGDGNIDEEGRGKHQPQGWATRLLIVLG